MITWFSFYLHWLRIPKIWRRVLLIPIPKLMKPEENPKSYWPIFLLCVSYKIFQRLIYARIEPIIDPLLPREQAQFWCRKSTMDPVILLIENIEDFFVNLTMAYDCMAFLHAACDFCQLGTGLEWPWSLSKISALNKFYPYYWCQPAKQDLKSEKQLSSGIGLGSSPFQFFYIYIYSTSALPNFLKVYLLRQSSIVALLWKLKGIWQA